MCGFAADGKINLNIFFLFSILFSMMKNLLPKILFCQKNKFLFFNFYFAIQFPNNFFSSSIFLFIVILLHYSYSYIFAILLNYNNSPSWLRLGGIKEIKIKNFICARDLWLTRIQIKCVLVHNFIVMFENLKERTANTIRKQKNFYPQ